MNIDPILHQQMLELIYDLLPPDEAEPLKMRIENDPEIAALFQETRKTAGIFAEAAKLSPPPSIVPSSKEKPSHREITRHTSLKAPRPADATRRQATYSENDSFQSRQAKRQRGYYILVSGLAIGLLATTLFGVISQKMHFGRLSNQHLHVRVTGPPYLIEGETNGLTVDVSNILGEPKRSPVHLTVRSVDGNKIFGHTEQTDQEGKARFRIDENLKLPEKVELNITAGENAKEAIQTRLSVLPPVAPTYLTTDKPLYAPGESLYFRTQVLPRTVSAANNKEEREHSYLTYPAKRSRELNVLLTDPQGTPRNQQITVDQSLNLKSPTDVAQGQIQLPSMMAHGAYLLNAIPQSSTPTGDGYARTTAEEDKEEKTSEGETLAFPHLMQQQLVLNVSRPEIENGPVAHLQTTAPFSTRGDRANSASPQPLRRNADNGVGGTDGPVSSLLADDSEDVVSSEMMRSSASAVQAGGISNKGEGTKKTEVRETLLFRFFPEGGNLVAGLENRVFFRCDPTSSAPPPVLKTLLQDAAIVDGRQETVTTEFTTYDHLGEFTFRPEANERYYLVYHDDPDSDRHSVPLPSIARGVNVVPSAGLGIFEPTEPIEFHLRAARPNLPLVVTAFQQGVPLDQQMLVTRQGANPVRLQFDDTVMGVVRLSVFDFSQSPPRMIASRLVFRKPMHYLKLKRQIERNRYGSGATIRLQTTVKNEDDRPTSASLGVSIVEVPDGKWIDPTHRPTLQLWRWYGEAFGPRELEISPEWEYLENLRKLPETEAQIALDLFLGTRGNGVEKAPLPNWPTHRMAMSERSTAVPKPSPTSYWEKGGSFADKLATTPMLPLSAPPMVFDNLPDLKESFQDKLAKLQIRGKVFSRAITVLGILGGMSMIMLALILNVLGLTVGMRSLGAAVVVGIACILLCSLLNPKVGSQKLVGKVAFANHRLATGPSAERRPDRLGIESVETQDRVSDPERDEKNNDLPAEATANKDLFLEAETRRSEAAEAARKKGQKDFSVGRSGLPVEKSPALGERSRAKLLESMEEPHADADADAGVIAPKAPPTDRPEGQDFARDEMPAPEIDSLPLTESEKEKVEVMDRRSPKEDHFSSAAKSFGGEFEATPSLGRTSGQVPSVMRTLYWNPELQTDSEGKAEIVFDLPDATRPFHVVIDATDDQGRIGSLRFQVPPDETASAAESSP